MSSVFSCITCQASFNNLEIQRQHYKSEWHRYNLKRKVIEYPPITPEEFQERVTANNDLLNQSNNTQNFLCKICRKHFNTKNQYDNHLISKKHKEKSLKTSSILENSYEEVDSQKLKNLMTEENNFVSMNSEQIDADLESINLDDWVVEIDNPVVNNNCLFCNHHSKSWVRNLRHMIAVHSFFIPDPEYCIDFKGLLEYLGEKIFGDYVCIWCNKKGKAFKSADAVRTHMLDKGHCKMLHEGEALAEYTDFYDYSSSYPDNMTSDQNEGVDPLELDDYNYQLVLPRGSVIGHRSLMTYYKQNLNPNPILALPMNKKQSLSIFKSLNLTEKQKECKKLKIMDIRYMKMMQYKYSTKLNFKANKLQTHFRQQVNF